MTSRIATVICMTLLTSVVFTAESFVRADEAGKAGQSQGKALPTRDEARAQAELLHDVFNATLHEVHARYFREDEKITIPAVALDAVFQSVAARRKVNLRWLAVDTPAMNIDHEPKSGFEKNSAKAIAAGAEQFENVEGGVYRRTGSIVLKSECLKCHLPLRKSNRNRHAGLLISIPIRGE